MDRVFYKLDIRGIVYLVDTVTTLAYTYELSNPTEVGKVIWTDSSKPPTIEFLPNIADIMAKKVTEMATTT
jgi:hypothetical protein